MSNEASSSTPPPFLEFERVIAHFVDRVEGLSGVFPALIAVTATIHQSVEDKLFESTSEWIDASSAEDHAQNGTQESHEPKRQSNGSAAKFEGPDGIHAVYKDDDEADVAASRMTDAPQKLESSEDLGELPEDDAGVTEKKTRRCREVDVLFSDPRSSRIRRDGPGRVSAIAGTSRNRSEEK